MRLLNIILILFILLFYPSGTVLSQGMPDYELKWQQTYDGGSTDTGYAIKCDDSSNIYIVGAKNSQDIYIAKYGPKTIYLPAYSLTGTIIDSEENLPVSGVNIYISSGDITISTKTNDSGTYIFENVDMATYSVIPSRVNYEFIPASATVYLSENTALNFSAVLVIPPTYYLSGIIKDIGGNPLESITVYIASRTSIDTFTDFESTVTDSSGRYEFQNLIKNNYRVCPVKDGYGFSPAQYYYSSLREIKEFQNFMMINWDIKQNEIKTNFVRPINNVINPKDNKPVIVQYNLAESGYTKIGIYTLEGALVKLLVDEYRYAGPGTAEWYCENAVNEIVSSGIYLVRVETPKNTLIKKICVIK